MPPYRPDPLEVRDAVRETLAGAGLSEVVTYALVSPRIVERVPGARRRRRSRRAGARAAGRPIVVTNPLSSQHSVLRQSLIGSLLEVVSTNLRHGRDDVAIFEIGKGYGAPATATTHEWWRLGFALTGAAEPPAWNRPARPYDLDDAKGVVELICRRLGFDAADVHADHRRSATSTPGAPLGSTGGRPARRPGRRAASGVDRDAASCAPSGSSSRRSRSAGSPAAGSPTYARPRRRASRRSSATWRSSSRSDAPAGDVEAAIRRHGGPLLRDVALFDIYRGAPLAEARRAWPTG